MDNDELIKRFRIAKNKYYNERAQIADDYFKANLKFKVGDIVFVKSRYNWEGYVYVNDIYFKNIDDFISDPYSYVPVVQIAGWMVDENGYFSRCLSHYNSCSANAQDVIRVVNITLKEPIPKDEN